MTIRHHLRAADTSLELADWCAARALVGQAAWHRREARQHYTRAALAVGVRLAPGVVVALLLLRVLP